MKNVKITTTLGGFQVSLGNTKGIGRTLLAAIVSFDEEDQTFKQHEKILPKYRGRKPYTKKL